MLKIHPDTPEVSFIHENIVSADSHYYFSSHTSCDKGPELGVYERNGKRAFLESDRLFT